MALTDQTRERAREIIARYPQKRSALLPMLHLVQAEEGHVSPAGIALCAEELGLTKAEVGAVATFYTMYKRRPAGEWLVSVCTNISCQLLGAEDVYACLSKHLGIGHNETTANGTFTLEHAECLAACDYAPVMTVNYEFYDNVTPDSALDLVQSLARGERPAPSRGEQLRTFREISMELAGFRADDLVRATYDSDQAAHPQPPEPIDVRGTIGTEGTDIDFAPDAGEFGVPGGITEETLSDADAAKTWDEHPGSDL